MTSGMVDNISHLDNIVKQISLRSASLEIRKEAEYNLNQILTNVELWRNNISILRNTQNSEIIFFVGKYLWLMKDQNNCNI